MDSADTPLVTALKTLGKLPEASAGAARVSQAVRSVRFSTGLRRGWEGARTESSIRWVLADCRRSGIDVTAKTLREQVAWQGEPEERVAAASWRCHSDAVAEMPPLNTKDLAPPSHRPVRAMLASLHRDAGSTDPQDDVREEAGILSEEDAAKQELIIEVAEANAPGLIVLSVLAGQWIMQPLSVDADRTIRDSFIRWLGTVRGFEPTGTAVLNLDSLESQIALYSAGTQEGMDAWIGAVADVYVDAMSESLRISQSVLAGRTDPLVD